MNVVILVGRMTKDVELRKLSDGKTVATFTVAIKRTYKANDGQDADFIQCVVWGRMAENLGRYCEKGSLIGVEGRLSTRSYNNSYGHKTYVTEVMCSNIQYLNSKRNTSNFDIQDDDIQF